VDDPGDAGKRKNALAEKLRVTLTLLVAHSSFLLLIIITITIIVSSSLPSSSA